MTESGVCVSIRCRPLNDKEAQANDPGNWLKMTDNTVDFSGSGQSAIATYDRVFGPKCETTFVYQSTAKSIVTAAMEGYNGTVFCYGQTASGKTFTMFGSQRTPGIIRLAATDIFAFIENTPDREFCLRASMVEIYNENDLLATAGSKPPKMMVHEDIQSPGSVVLEAERRPVSSADELLKLLLEGESRASKRATNMNDESSRSHTVFRLYIESKQRVAEDQEAEIDGSAFQSELNVVDLAGSENAKQTGDSSEGRREAHCINKSLLALSTVIMHLSTQRETITYRESILTRLLQNALKGNSKMAIICNISPAVCNQCETTSTLRFASSAKQIKSCAQKNVVEDDKTMLKKYKKQIAVLTKSLEEAKNDLKTTEGQGQMDGIIAERDEERTRVKEMQEKIAKLTSQLAMFQSFIAVSGAGGLALSVPGAERNNRRYTMACFGARSNSLFVPGISRINSAFSSAITSNGPPRAPTTVTTTSNNLAVPNRHHSFNVPNASAQNSMMVVDDAAALPDQDTMIDATLNATSDSFLVDDFTPIPAIELNDEGAKKRKLSETESRRVSATSKKVEELSEANKELLIAKAQLEERLQIAEESRTALADEAQGLRDQLLQANARLAAAETEIAPAAAKTIEELSARFAECEKQLGLSCQQNAQLEQQVRDNTVAFADQLRVEHGKLDFVLIKLREQEVMLESANDRLGVVSEEKLAFIQLAKTAEKERNDFVYKLIEQSDEAEAKTKQAESLVQEVHGQMEKLRAEAEERERAHQAQCEAIRQGALNLENELRAKIQEQETQFVAKQHELSQALDEVRRLQLSYGNLLRECNGNGALVKGTPTKEPPAPTPAPAPAMARPALNGPMDAARFREENVQLRRQIGVLTGEVKSREGKVKSLEKMLDDKANKLEKAALNASKHEEKIRELKSEKASLAQQLQQKEAECKENRHRLDRVDRDNERHAQVLADERAKLQKLHEEMQLQMNVNNATMEAKDKLAKELEEQRDQLARVSLEKDRLLQDIESWKQAETASKQHQEGLEQKIQEWSKKWSATDAELRAAVQAGEALNAQLNEANEHSSQLETQKDNVIQGLNSTVQNLQQQLTALAAERDSLCQETERAGSEIHRLGDQIRNGQQEVAMLNTVLGEKQSKMDGLAQDLDQAQQCISGQTLQLAEQEELISGLKETLGEQQLELESLKAALESHQSEIAQLREQCNTLGTEKGAALQELASAKAELEVLEQQCQEFEESLQTRQSEWAEKELALNNDLTHQREECARLESRVQQCESQLGTAAQEADGLRSRLNETIGAHKTAAAEANQAISSLQQQLARKEADVQTLTHDLDDIAAKRREEAAKHGLELSEKSSRLLQLEADLEAALEEKQTVLTANAELEDNLSKANAQLATETQRRASLETQLQEQTTGLRSEIQKLTSDLESTTSDLRVVQSSYCALMAERETLIADVSSKSALLEETQTRCESLLAMYEKEHTTADELAADAERLSNELRAAEERMEELEANAEQMQSDLQTLRVEKEVLAESVVAKDAEVLSLSTSAEQLKAKVEELSEQAKTTAEAHANFVADLKRSAESQKRHDQGQLAVFEATVTQLKDQIAGLEAANRTERANTRRQTCMFNSHDQQLKRVVEEMNTMRESLQKAEQENRNLSDQLRRTREEAAQVTHEQKERIGRLEAEKLGMQGQLHDAQKEFESDKANYVALVKRLKDQIAELEETYDPVDEENQKLLNETAALKEQLQRHQAKDVAAKQKYAQLYQKYEDLKTNFANMRKGFKELHTKRKMPIPDVYYQTAHPAVPDDDGEPAAKLSQSETSSCSSSQNPVVRQPLGLLNGTLSSPRQQDPAALKREMIARVKTEEASM